jgi:hypothetical protein
LYSGNPRASSRQAGLALAVGCPDRFARLFSIQLRSVTCIEKQLYRFRTGPRPLHVEPAVAGNARLLISCAAPPEHAMSLNIEFGILITSRVLPCKLNLPLDDFIERGAFVGIF